MHHGLLGIVVLALALGEVEPLDKEVALDTGLLLRLGGRLLGTVALAGDLLELLLLALERRQRALVALLKLLELRVGVDLHLLLRSRGLPLASRLGILLVLLGLLELALLGRHGRQLLGTLALALGCRGLVGRRRLGLGLGLALALACRRRVLLVVLVDAILAVGVERLLGQLRQRLGRVAQLGLGLGDGVLGLHDLILGGRRAPPHLGVQRKVVAHRVHVLVALVPELGRLLGDLVATVDLLDLIIGVARDAGAVTRRDLGPALKLGVGIVTHPLGTLNVRQAALLALELLLVAQPELVVALVDVLLQLVGRELLDHVGELERRVGRVARSGCVLHLGIGIGTGLLGLLLLTRRHDGRCGRDGRVGLRLVVVVGKLGLVVVVGVVLAVNGRHRAVWESSEWVCGLRGARGRGDAKGFCQNG